MIQVTETYKYLKKEFHKYETTEEYFNLIRKKIIDNNEGYLIEFKKVSKEWYTLGMKKDIMKKILDSIYDEFPQLCEK